MQQTLWPRAPELGYGQAVEETGANLGLATFVCACTSMEALAHTAVLHRSETLSDGAVETLINETTRLVVGISAIVGVIDEGARALCGIRTLLIFRNVER